MQRVCDYEGCTNGIETGHALHRVSPKGKGMPFVGMCDEHYIGQPDPVAQVFQRANHRGTCRYCDRPTAGDVCRGCAPEGVPSGSQERGEA